MGRVGVCAAVLAVVFAGAGGPASADPPTLPNPQLLPSAAPAESAQPEDRVLVQWRASATKAARAAARAEASPAASTRLGSPDWQVLTVAPGESARVVAARLAKDPAVRSAEPDFAVERTADATDPKWSSLWGLKNTGQKVGGVASGTPGADIDASGAWDKTVGVSSTVVAVIDDGFRFTHPDLASNLWTNPGEIAGNNLDDDANGVVDDVHGADFSGATYDGDPTDTSPDGGHGTHVAGTIAATRNNGRGIAGVAPGVQLMPLRVCGGTPFTCPGSALVAAINYAGRKGAKVVNMSLSSTQQTNVFRDAMASWPNTLFVVAAGNENFNNDSAYLVGRSANPAHPCVDNPATSGIPGAIDNVICVAATDQTDSPASFTNWGATTVDVAAPGTEILSTSTWLPTWAQAINSDFNYTGWIQSGFAVAQTLDGDWWQYTQPPGTGQVSYVRTPGIAVQGPATCTMTADIGYGTGFNAAGLTWAPVIDGVVGTAAPIGVLSWPLTVATSGSHTLGLKISYTQGATTTAYVLVDDYALSCYTAPGSENGDLSYEFKQGTSMASPHVAGVAGLLASYEPGATTAQLRSAVLAGVDSVARMDPVSGTKPIASGGRTDATKSLNAIDRAVAPDTAILSVVPAGGLSNTNVRFTFGQRGTNAPVWKYQCAVTAVGGSPAFSDCTSPYTTATASGTWRFHVRAVDTQATADASPATSDFAIDTIPPDTTIGQKPGAASASTSATFGFSSEAGATFECSIDSGAFSACTSPKTYTGLSQGGHTFQVRAKDAAGNTDATPASYTWTVDTVAPSVSITGGPADGSTIASASASFPFTAEAGASTECKLDGASYASCVSPKAYSGLTEGTHTFTVRATDAAGNSATASRTWTVNTVVPDTTITSGPSGSVKTTDATFTFTSTQPGTFECRIDTGLYAACTTPKTYTGLAEGSHTFSVRAKNLAAVYDASPASRTWNVDTTAPNTTITGGPSGPVASTSAQFTFSSTEPGTFSCSFDYSIYVPCTSPQSYSALNEGQHTLVVRATDLAGNADPSPDSRIWTVDTIPPAVSITGGPADNSFSKSMDAQFTFTAETGAAVSCTMDGNAASNTASGCVSPFLFAGMQNGTHVFTVTAKDAALNNATATRTWTIDTVRPTATITSGPSGFVNATTATFGFTSSELGTFECRLDNGIAFPCTSPQLYSGLGQGAHTFTVVPKDRAGNVGDTQTRSWTVDTIPPAVTITGGPAAVSTVSATSATFTFTAEANATVKCQINGSAFTACSSPKTYSALADGPQSFTVSATDAAQNTATASRSWRVDTAAPDTTITSKPGDFSNSTTASFAFSSEPGATFECKLDAGAFAACTSPKSLLGLTAGPHTFSVRAKDAASNTDPSPATHTWTVDLTAPDTIITSGPSGTTGPAVTITFSSEPGATFECRLDAAPFASCASPRQLRDLPEGQHTFEVRGLDAAANADPSPAQRTWIVDATPPGVTISGGPAADSTVTTSTATFVFSAEAGATTECQLDGAEWAACTSPFGTGPVSDGPHTFGVRATDAHGNAASVSRAWAVDTTPPAVFITVGPVDSSQVTAAITMTATEAATFECQLDGGPVSACTSPVTFPGLPVGAHTVSIWATDMMGLRGAPAVWTWTVRPPDDNPAPPPPPTSLKVAFPKQGRARVTWLAVTGATSYEVRISKRNSSTKFAGWVRTTSPKVTFKKLKKKAKYVVEVKSVGAAGSGSVARIAFKQRK